MVRYAKQRTAITCGPTVIINAIKWTGLPVSWKKHIKKCMKLCGCGIKGNRGTWTWNLDYALNFMVLLNVKKKIHYPKLKQIDEHLDKDRAIIIGYLHDEGGHYILCVGRTKKYYKVVNSFEKGPALRKIARKTMSKKLRTVRMEPGALFHSMAWVIEGVLK